MSRFIEKYFSKATENEVLFRCVNTPQELNDIIESFYYFLKVQATGELRKELRACAYRLEADQGNAEQILFQLMKLNSGEAVRFLRGC